MRVQHMIQGHIVTELENRANVTDYYNAEYGREHSPFLDIQKQWETKIDFYLR